MDQRQDRGQVGVDPRHAGRKDGVQTLQDGTAREREVGSIKQDPSRTTDTTKFLQQAPHLCLPRSPSRVLSPSSANMSSPGTSDQEAVMWWRVEVKVWRMDREECRSTQTAALHLARKSGNSALSQSTWDSPIESSCAGERCRRSS